MGKSKILAITVSKHYLDHHLWAIKLMSIYYTKHSGWIWYTNKIVCTHSELAKLKPMAIEYGLNNNMPFIAWLNKGECVRPHDLRILKKHYGVCFSELIT